MHDQGRDRVGHQMPPHDLRQAGTDGDRGFDIRLLARRQHHRAHQPRDARNLRDGNGDEHRHQAGAGQRDHGNGEQDARDRHQPIHDAHHHRVDPFEKAGDEADHEADADADDGSTKSDQERDPSAIENPRQHVAAIAVGAQQELRARGLQPLRGNKQQRIVRRKPGRQDRGSDHQRKADGSRGDDRRRREESEPRPERRGDRDRRLWNGFNGHQYLILGSSRV